MKLVQLNIWMGYLLHSALDFIEREDPDIVCVQEVMGTDTGTPLFDIYQTHEQLAALFPFNFFAPTYTFEAFGEEIRYGNATYSKLPLDNQKTDFTYGEFTEHQTFKDFQKNIRNLQRCTITLPGGKSFGLANHHGYHDFNRDGTPEADSSMRSVAHCLQEVTSPLVLCGDFNMNAASSVLRELDVLQVRNLTQEAAIPTTLSSASRIKDKLACDYILVSHNIKVKSFYAAEELVSDHKALVLEFELNA